jgi:hypothetical protein
MPNSTTCFECPGVPGVICPEGSQVPWVGTGLFRSLSNPGDVFICYPPESCAGTPGFGNSSCSAGYTGVRCNLCEVNFFRSGGKCLKCLPKEGRWILITVSLLLLFIIASKFSRRQNAIPSSVRILLFWFQFLSIYPTLSTAWPSSLFTVLNFTRVFNVDFGYFGFECDAGPISYYWIASLKIMLPILFFLFLSFENLLIKLLKKRAINVSRTIFHSLFVTNFLSLQLMSTMLEVFNCREVSAGVWVVKSQPSIECHSEGWNQYIVFVSFALFFYLFLIPATLVWKYRISKKGEDPDRSFLLLLKPLVSYYRPGAEYFELFRLSFRLVFVLVVQILSLSSASKATFLLLMLGILVWIESNVMPYDDATQQELSML